MSFFEWKEDYSVEIKKIDTQHEKLVGYLNELYESMKAGDTGVASPKRSLQATARFSKLTLTPLFLLLPFEGCWILYSILSDIKNFSYKKSRQSLWNLSPP